MKNTKLVWTTVQRKVKDLLPFKNNPRRMSEKQIADLTKSLKKFDLVEIPAIDTDGKILAGHQRVAVLQLLGRGEEMIDVRIPSRPLTKSEYEQYLLISNKVHGDWDYEMLADYFDIDTLADSGFDQSEITDIFANTLSAEEDDFDTEKELAKIKKTSVKVGDLYQLGKHRILCGDSTKAENIARLVDKEKIDMIYCDPIYNLSVTYSSGIGGKANYGGNVNDTRSDIEYREFIRKSIMSALSVAKKDCHVFYWNDQSNIGLMQDLYRELGIENKRVCLWVKNQMNPVPLVAFGKCYEACIYGVRGKPFLSKTVQKLNEILNPDMVGGNELLEQIEELFDIWINKRIAGQKYSHATEKPVRLHEKPIKRCSRPGDTILDLFSGSGSTLIAAEMMKRVAYVAELEPVFVDLAIRRYEKLTGTKAVKINEN